MANLAGLAMGLGALGDALGSTLGGAVQGAVMGPELRARIDEANMKRQLFPLHLQREQLGLRGAQQRLEHERQQLTQPQMFQHPYGIAKVSPTGDYLGEVPLPRPKMEDLGNGFVRVTTPDGVTKTERQVSPERTAAAIAESNAIAPTDKVGLMRFAIKYPEFSGPLGTMMESWRKAEHDAAQARYWQSLANRPAAGSQPRTVVEERPGGPLEGFQEEKTVQEIFTSLVGKPAGAGWFGTTVGGVEAVPGLIAQTWPGWDNPAIDTWTVTSANGKTDTISRAEIIRLEMRKRHYDVQPFFNKATGQWEPRAITRMPKITNKRTTIGEPEGAAGPAFMPSYPRPSE
jgi:hypothetical protein